MICPVCTQDTEPAGLAGPIAICGSCGMALYVDAADTVRRSTLKDLETLTPEQVTTLRKAAGPLRRRKV